MTAQSEYTDIIDVNDVHQVRLYDRAMPPPASFPDGKAWYRAQVHFTLSDGSPRQYRIDVPRGLGGPAPFVYAFHGYSQGATAAMVQQHWEALAPSKHFVVVYGYGQPNASWNAGRCCASAAAARRADTLYISSIIQLSAHEYPQDAHRIYLAGFSNGAMLADRYACENPTQIAAVLDVAGTNASTCTPGPGTGAVAIRNIHGDTDPVVPYDGTAHSALLGCALTPIPDTVRQWTTADSGSTWASVSATRVAGMGHVWPSGRTYGIDATNEGWRFFWAHRRP